MGNGSVIRPGDVQRMSAGPGVVHSEFNASPSEPVHFLQIWIVPERAGLPSGYEQKSFTDEDKRGRLRLIASRDGAEGSVRIQQDARVYATLLAGGASVSHTIAAGRKGWLHVVRGGVELNGQHLRAGDGVAIDPAGREEKLSLASADQGEVLLFDMA
jgi:redox-sensitive bicupin YhaK (pirin superfamily)